jgi:hypothetical protein
MKLVIVRTGILFDQSLVLIAVCSPKMTIAVQEIFD